MPWSKWPAPAKVALAESLVRFNRLDTVTNVSKNIANLSCTCREMRDLCRTLWGSIAAAVEPDVGDPQTPWWDGAPPRKRLENTAFDFDPTYQSPWPLMAQEVKVEVESGEYSDSPLPQRLAAEIMRLASRYLPESRACKEYCLHPSDLKEIEEVTVGQPGQGLGYMHLRRLSDVAAVAQRKHGNFETLKVLLEVEKGKEKERGAQDAKKRVGADGWLSEYTCYDQLVAQEAYANSKRRKVLKNKALVDWVQGEWGGDVDKAVKSQAVKSAPKEAHRSVIAMIRAAWKGRGAGGGGGGGGGRPGGSGAAGGGGGGYGGWFDDFEGDEAG
jgi:hypothetical protein